VVHIFHVLVLVGEALEIVFLVNDKFINGFLLLLNVGINAV